MIGIDIVKISRIKNASEAHKLEQRILTKSEIDYLKTKSMLENEAGISQRMLSLAGLFAAKEAVLKAFGVGLSCGHSFKDIEIWHDETGAPQVKLHKMLKELLKERGKSAVMISIAHDADYAVANCNLVPF